MKILLLLVSLALAQGGELSARLDAYMAAWNAHDSHAAAAFLDEQVEYFDAAASLTARGRDEAKAKIIAAFMTAAPDLRWTRDPGSEIVGENAIAFTWTFTGTNTGAWSDGTAATGKRFSIKGATLIRVRNGKIVSQGDYYDAHALYKQLGLVQ